MKNRFGKLIRKVVAPLALIGMLAAFNPASAFAAGRGGFGGHGGGGFSGHGGGFAGNGGSFGGHSGNFGGHAFSAPARGGFEGGHGFYGGGGRYVAPRYYGRGGLGFGVGVGVYPSYGYGYAAPVCNPAGYYDQYGNWQPYPGCAWPDYGY